MMANRKGDEIAAELNSLDEGMTELALLLPAQKARALAQSAQDEGISLGQFLRRLLDQALGLASANRCGSSSPTGTFVKKSHFGI